MKKYNNGNNEWLLVHGSGESMERLQESAVGEEVEIVGIKHIVVVSLL